MNIAINAIKVAPGLIKLRELIISEKVFSPSRWKKAKFPSRAELYPKKCGICFKIIMIPIPVSIPLITEDGK